MCSWDHTHGKVLSHMKTFTLEWVLVAAICSEESGEIIDVVLSIQIYHTSELPMTSFQLLLQRHS